jgi:KDO2-lipid IV(A) lauroyltransferase
MNSKYWGLCLVAGVARFVPLHFGYWLADPGGDLFFLLSARRRYTVSNNIQRAVGIENKNALNRQVRCVFRNAARNYFDLTKLSKMDLKNLEGQVKIEGIPHLTEAVNNGKGVIIATAHLGNFEFSAHVLAAQGFEMLILIEDFDDSNPFLRKLAGLRRGAGVRIFPVDMTGLKECLKTLRRGGIVTMVCDRDIQGNGVKTPFFGEETAFPVGVVDLALRTGASVVPIFGLRGPKNTTSIFIEPPLNLTDHENPDQATRANLEVLVAVLEKYIRKYPEQWVVLEPV